MNRIIFLVATMFVLNDFTSTQFLQAAADVDGKTLFKDNCKACHTIGNGKLVGPDLKDIDKKRSEVWLMSWIKSSKSLINAKDSIAVALFEEYFKVPMTEFPALSELQVKAILDYIKTESNPVASVALNPVVQQDQSRKIQAPGWFSTPFNLLLGLIGLLLVVIYYLSISLKRLMAQLADYYSDDKSFY